MRDITGNSCLGTRQHVSLELSDRKSDNWQLRKNFPSLRRDLEAIANREIEEQNVRMQCCDLVEEVAGTPRPDHVQLATQDRGKPVPVQPNIAQNIDPRDLRPGPARLCKTGIAGFEPPNRFPFRHLRLPISRRGHSCYRLR